MTLKRTTLKQEIATKLFPDSQSAKSAMQLLRNEIRQTPNLSQKLFEKSSNKYLHYFSHKQVETLLNHFCITKQEYQQL